MNKVILIALVLLGALICTSQAAFSLTKKYYFGGKFASATYGTTTKSASNIVSWSGAQWDALADGFNGPVNDIYLDSSFNVYAVGEFSASGSVATGPVAIYLNNKWSSIVDGATWSAGSSVNTISVDCFNLPSTSSLALNCDIFVGGNFTLTFGGATIRNLARYTASSKKWEALTGSNGINLPLTSPVKVVYKKEGGVSLVSDSLYYLWVGGSFGLYMYHTKNNVWTVYSDAIRVNWLYYKRNLIATDVVYVCGAFSISCADGKTCVNVAALDHKTKAFSQIGATALLAPVDICQLGDNNYLYVIGNGLTTTAETKYLAKVKVDSASTSNWIPGIAISSGITKPLADFDVCGDADTTCTAGSLAFAGNNIMGYYNAQDNSYQPFGNGTAGTGDNRCVRGTYKFSSAATSKWSIVMLLVAALLFLL